MTRKRKPKLTPQRAIDDTGGETVTVSARVPPELKQWLKTLPEGESYHIRQALKLYRETYDQRDRVAGSDSSGA